MLATPYLDTCCALTLDRSPVLPDRVAAASAAASIALPAKMRAAWLPRVGSGPASAARPHLRPRAGEGSRAAAERTERHRAAPEWAARAQTEPSRAGRVTELLWSAFDARSGYAAPVLSLEKCTEYNAAGFSLIKISPRKIETSPREPPHRPWNYDSTNNSSFTIGNSIKVTYTSPYRRIRPVTIAHIKT